MHKFFIDSLCLIGFHKAYKEKGWTTQKCKNCHKIEKHSVYNGTT